MFASMTVLSGQRDLAADATDEAFSRALERWDRVGCMESPAGWTYRTRILDEELVVDTTATVATVLQDELENTYTLPG